MNSTSDREDPVTKHSALHALRCSKAVDEIEPNEDSLDDDEVTRLVQFNGMIGVNNLIYGLD